MDFSFETILSIIISVLATLVVSYIFYKKSIKKKKIVFDTISTVLISDHLSRYKNLKLSYNDVPIQSLTITTITLQNIGNDMILPDDFVKTSSIILTCTESLLSNDTDLYTINSSNQDIDISLSLIDDNSIRVNFDFFNPKDKVKITVLHVGEISVTGKLKYGSFIIRKNGKAMTFYQAISTVTSSLLLAGGFFIGHITPLKYVNSVVIGLVLGSITAIVFTILRSRKSDK